LDGVIPPGLFANCTKVTDFSYVLSDCSALTGSIPSNLFGSNSAVLKMFGLLHGCSGLTGEIPGSLFSGLPSLTQVYAVFSFCSGLISIGTGLFDNNINITHFGITVSTPGTFHECSGLTGTIPLGLFDNNINAVNFINCFEGCSLITGDAPDLWNDFPTANGDDCFNSCNFNNQASIPIDWK